MRFLSTCEGRNTSTCRGRIGTSSPVLGLRPMRRPLRRTEKLPNDEILTISPRASASEISRSTVSTRSADSFRDRPTSWYTASPNWARVTVVSDIPPSRSSHVTLAAGMKCVNYKGMARDLIPICGKLPQPTPRPFRLAPGPPSAGARNQLWRPSPSHPDERGTPGEAAAHGLQQDQLAGADPAVADPLGERQRDRGGRRVGVAVDRQDHAVGRHVELLGGGVGDPAGGLGRAPPVGL